MTPLFTVHPSPIGDILIVTRGDDVAALHPLHAPLETEIEALSLQMRTVVEPGESDAATTAAEQLDEYFDGERTGFALPLEWDLVRGFTRRALEAVSEIPYGETASYGEVAILAGAPGAARAVGTACRLTPFSVVVPVHRVIRADGSIGEYGGHPEVKRFLLDLESP